MKISVDSNSVPRFTQGLLLGVLLLSAIHFAPPSGAQGPFENPLWDIPAGSRDYVTASATERGIAVNPVTGNVLIVSRASGLRVAIVDGQTGAEVGELDSFDVGGGTFPLSAIGVAEDGAIYGANLVVSASESSPFKIYRWANELAFAEVVYEGSPSDGMRFGDSLDVRGSGASTQIAAGTSGNATEVRFVIFTTTDGTAFEAHPFAPAGVAAGQMQKGISFAEGDTIVGKTNGSPGHHTQFNLADGGSTVLNTVPIALAISPVSVEPSLNQLAGVDYAAHELVIYSLINGYDSPNEVARVPFPTPNVANGNGVGAVDYGPDLLVALDTQNGVLALPATSTEEGSPMILNQPEGQTVLEGSPVSFSVGVIGAVPRTYQWYHNDVAISGATDPQYAIDQVRVEDAGNYYVEVSNAEGTATSETAVLEVTPFVTSPLVSTLWTLEPGDRDYLTTDNTQRGMAYHAGNNHLYLVSRALGPTNIYVLDGDTGADLHRLRTVDALDEPAVSGGLFLLNMVAVADDGAVYACNLSTSGTDFKIYRWANDDPETIPVEAYFGDPALDGDFSGATGVQRWGDSIAARGSGVDTQILCASRNGTVAALFTTLDGETFWPTIIQVADLSNGDIGLGIDFGNGNTFWGTAPGRALRHVKYDLAAGTGTLLHTFEEPDFPGFISPIGVGEMQFPDGGNATAKQVLAGIALEGPDNVRLYDLSDLEAGPSLIHQVLFPTANANANGTGAVAVSSDRVYALDTNNGIVALTVTDEPPSVLSISRDGDEVVIEWTGGVLQASDEVDGPYMDVAGASSPHRVNTDGAPRRFWRLRL